MWKIAWYWDKGTLLDPTTGNCRGVEYVWFSIHLSVQNLVHVSQPDYRIIVGSGVGLVFFLFVCQRKFWSKNYDEIMVIRGNCVVFDKVLCAMR